MVFIKNCGLIVYRVEYSDRNIQSTFVRHHSTQKPLIMSIISHGIPVTTLRNNRSHDIYYILNYSLFIFVIYSSKLLYKDQEVYKFIFTNRVILSHSLSNLKKLDNQFCHYNRVIILI